ALICHKHLEQRVGDTVNIQPRIITELCNRSRPVLVVVAVAVRVVSPAYCARALSHLRDAAVCWLMGAMYRLKKHYKAVLIVVFLIAIFIIVSEIPGPRARIRQYVVMRRQSVIPGEAIWLIPQRPPCLWPFLLFRRFPKLSSTDNTDLTIVTAYLNLGHMGKAGSTFGLYKYLRWAGVFQYVQNPVVVYTDSEQVENMFLETRRHLTNKTRIIRVHRSELSAFRDVERIRILFENPDYPKHQPNTVFPEYPCSQHAKFEFVQDALHKEYFSFTKYIAWVDIGYFRYLTNRRRKFWVVVPPDLDDAKVAVTQVYRPDFSLTPEDVFKGNLVWVGGGMSIATRPVFAKYAEEYQTATSKFLGEGLSNTDQQVVYSMFTDVNMWTQRLETKLQTYSWDF
ncbi:hypothetical protein BaRGS_00006193, partial [Batillaria attramentaria]